MSNLGPLASILALGILGIILILIWCGL